jgi:hypothetical protein
MEASFSWKSSYIPVKYSSTELFSPIHR